MTIQLDHTIIHATDPEASARFLADLLGLAPPKAVGPFHVVQVDNHVSLDFMADDRPIRPQHYAFLVGETEFDEIFARITARGLRYWADPIHRQPGQINTRDGGRGVYWPDPDRHNMEILTKS
ncbi:VOC family protein [Rhodococcus chondri]|uniref:VOC family protein n=1 Tax=Rhodococcus chondri TaxID=3065941 RepID=A0ABU7JNV9_9NOCA|nr:VOC family protein [Rhodococcus sp. CC-R104]MEE2031154.1 VOC family protein [Rhodococcus sp. CC-R104]